MGSFEVEVDALRAFARSVDGLAPGSAPVSVPSAEGVHETLVEALQRVADEFVDAQELLAAAMAAIGDQASTAADQYQLTEEQITDVAGTTTTTTVPQEVPIPPAEPPAPPPAVPVPGPVGTGGG